MILADTTTVRALNRRYLGHDRSTDVLSFPLAEGRILEGEVYVNLDRARAQARDYGVSYPEEVIRLVVHGTLHLAGYEDGTALARRAMRLREDRYVEALAGRRPARSGGRTPRRSRGGRKSGEVTRG